MQFVEANSFELVTYVYDLERQEESLKFVLFPMVHIGERDYYKKIAASAGNCDVLLVEGVPSLYAQIATLSYALFASRLGLVTQMELDVRSLGPKIVNADVSAQEFNNAYKKMPISVRFLFPLFLPLFGIYFLFNGSREILAKKLETNDLPSREDILNSSEKQEKMTELLVNERDNEFLKKLDKFFRKSTGNPLTVGIIYGAGHMPAIFRYLCDNLGYRVKSASRARVFSLL